MRILGLDPANNCGWAHSNGWFGTWKLSIDGDEHPGRRLERFRRHLFAIKREHGIDLIAAEDAGFGSHHAHVQALHNELRGVIKLCAAEWEVPVVLYKPNTIKSRTTGNGRSDKKTMIRFVESLYGVRTSDDNVADAVAIMNLAKIDHAKKESVSCQKLPF